MKTPIKILDLELVKDHAQMTEVSMLDQDPFTMNI